MRLQVYTTSAPGYALGTCFAGIAFCSLLFPERAQRSFGVHLQPKRGYPAATDERPDYQEKSEPFRPFGLPIGRSPEHAYFISKAGRDLTFGVLFAYLQWRNDQHAIMSLLGLLGIAYAADGYAVWACSPDETGRKWKVLQHCIGSAALVFSSWRALAREE
ncbi:hypothetical protein BKA67DRAFT_583681 [Truncatella angustata]|uniref:Uncharacterized protein n=1 Tax=Truncatella angustata TaxID=152316 RepID=A0A9P8RL15_9PEZI|nr:uncharacterized protein BKA67DRAFT_583681 [Truncatella angustata]KAH6646258.1 hypothetical protein BKA67DRAFT_583681 [Truncatella angustata]KAH8203936.1 hypothetical protein TruAng_001878 [Truncatella angustata]